MRLRSLFATASVFLAALVPSVVLSQSDVQGNLSITRKTEVPGTTLKPGNYTIHVVDHLSDRIVVRVDNSAGQKEALFLSVNAPNLSKSGSVIEWQNAGKGGDALRGYAFQNGPTVEFVYPKADAVRIAKQNSSSVVAIDPASEGRKPKNMSGEDLQLVSLWLLTPTRVGPDSQAAIAAKHFEATPEKGPVVASASSSSTPAATAGTQLAQADTRPELIQRKPTPTPHHVVKALPHTASTMPLVWMFALLFLSGALMLRRFRMV